MIISPQPIGKIIWQQISAETDFSGSKLHFLSRPRHYCRPGLVLWGSPSSTLASRHGYNDGQNDSIQWRGLLLQRLELSTELRRKMFLSSVMFKSYPMIEYSIKTGQMCHFLGVPMFILECASFKQLLNYVIYLLLKATIPPTLMNIKTGQSRP